jgi:hypothetical protein
MPSEFLLGICSLGRNGEISVLKEKIKRYKVTFEKALFVAIIIVKTIFNNIYY